jgi:hypothetical protein
VSGRKPTPQIKQKRGLKSMQIVNKTQGKATTYDKIDVGDVFKFENSICIAIDDDIILMYDPEMDVWNIENAPEDHEAITLLDCELVIKGEK